MKYANFKDKEKKEVERKISIVQKASKRCIERLKNQSSQSQHQHPFQLFLRTLKRQGLTLNNGYPEVIIKTSYKSLIYNYLRGERSWL